VSESSDVLLRRIHQVALRSDLRIALARGEPLRESLQACAETIVRHLGMPVAAIWWAGDGMLDLIARAGDGDPAPPRAIRRGEGPLGALVTNVTSLVQDGLVAYPLLGSNAVLGVLGLYTRGAVPAALVDELGWVADVISVSLESRARAEECDLANRVITLQMRVAQALASGESFASSLESALRTVAEGLGYGLGAYWPGAAALAGRALRSRDPVGEEGGVAVALRAGDDVIGVLVFFDRSGCGGDDRAALATLAGVVTQYIQRRRAEEHLAQSRKLEAVGRLAGGIAHDFNNILTVIEGSLEMATEHPGLPEDMREQLGDGLEAARRAAGLVRQLLAFSKNQVLEHRVIDLNPIVRDLDRMLRRLLGDRVELRATVPPRPSLAKADRGQIEQLVVNLVINARDAMPDGGEVHIELAHVELHPEPGEQPAGPCVMLAVTDTGTGMTEDVRRRAFEPFFTTKAAGQGTGLGLATAYVMVRQMGGAVRLESEPGRGTRVVILLPRSKRAAG
jgi:signal transduction histidine kinase